MINPLLKMLLYVVLLVALYACIIRYFSKDSNAEFNPRVLEILKTVGEDNRTVIISKPDTVIIITKGSEFDKADYISDPKVKFVTGEKVIQKPKSSSDMTKNGLVAYYPFNGNADDESGNKNHGIVHGATLTEDRFGNPKNAYYFDGNSWIAVNDDFSLRPSNSLTLSAWVKIENRNVDTYLRIISKHGEVTDAGGSHGSYQLVTGRPNERGKIYTTLRTDKKYFSTKPDLSVSLNEWHFVVSVWNGTEILTYVDSELVARTFADGIIKYDSNPLYIGRDGYYPNDFFKGKIDDVRIYNRSLNQDEIIKLREFKR